jgi:tRNA(Ile)-lysidine synthase
MLDNFLSYISTEYQINLSGSRVLLAVSGGIDSMVLLHLFQQLDVEIGVAHVDHHTRDGHSTLDAQFVKDYCYAHSIPFYLIDYKHTRGSFQDAARVFRYRRMKVLLKDYNYKYLLTAHHEDDNLESFLMGLSRGTGLNGLKGVLPVDLPILRPLLFTSKASIRNYADANKIAWVDDKSNTSNAYLRNRVRNILLPTLESVKAGYKEGLLQSHSILSKERALLNELLSKMYNSGHYQKKNRWYIDKSVYVNLYNGPTALFWFLQEYGFTFDQSTNMLTSKVGSLFQSAEHEVLVDRNALLLRAIQKKEDFFLESKTDIEFSYLGVDVSIHFRNGPKHITVRTRRAGDRVKLRNGLHKSLKKHLVDQKVNIWDKEDVLLLCMEDKVVDIIFPDILATHNAKDLGMDVIIKSD